MVEILDETNRFPHERELRTLLQALLDEYGLGDRELTLVLMEDAAIRELNRDHRGEDEPTDVLSYPTAEPDDAGMPTVAHLGDIFIGLGVAERQAAERGHDLLSETLVLAAHGLTHLRGYDHPTEEAWQIFDTAQRRILELRAAFA